MPLVDLRDDVAEVDLEARTISVNVTGVVSLASEVATMHKPYPQSLQRTASMP